MGHNKTYEWLVTQYNTNPKEWATLLYQHHKEVSEDLKVYKHYIVAKKLGITSSHLSYLKPLLEAMNANDS